MGLISNGVEKSKIKPGDHIYTWRAAYTYSHHGIYVGGSKVTHFTREQAPGDASSSLGSSFSSSGVSSSSIPSNFNSSASTTSDISWTCPTFPDCGFRQPNSGVVLSCVDCFLGNGNLYCFEYGVHPSFFLAKFRGGTCTTAKSDPPELVIHRAMFLFQKGFGNYNVFENNCEDFALYCKTGLLIPDKLSGMGISGQAASAFGAPLAALISSPLRFLMPSPVGVAIVTSGMYCVSRYATDIGVRTDVIKVAVEDMSVKLGWVGPSSNEVAEDKESSDRQDVPNNAPGTSSVTGKHKKSRYATDIGVHKDATMVAMEDKSVNLSSAGHSGKEVAEDKEDSNRPVPKNGSGTSSFMSMYDTYMGVHKEDSNRPVPKNGSGTSSFMSMYDTYMGVHKDALKVAMEDMSVNLRSVGRSGKEVAEDKENSNRLAPKNGSGTSSFSGKHKKSW